MATYQKEGYPLEWLQELKDKNNIVEVVSRYIQLQQKSGRFWGCCPFHHEKTASFALNEDGQFYHCFGCGDSGDVITFIQKIEGLSFPEAVQFLADRAGMEVPKTSGINSTPDAKKKRDRLYEILTYTAKYYHENLMSDKGAEARKYLENRGINRNLQIRFGLGFSVDYDGAINNLKAKGYREEEIIESGVGWVSERSKTRKPFDALQQRMIVPIFDSRGRVTAFSGRAITKDFTGGKYVNYKNTTVFEKGKTLYGANFVKREKQKTAVDKVIIVEGYMDVISLAKYGFNNAVAGMGTAFTPEQARAIHGLSENVCVCYDGDSAGQNATIKNLEILNAVGLNLKIVTIPVEGMDPDDYVKKFGHDGFEKLLDNALPYVEYVLSVIAKRHDLKTNTGRAKYVKEALDFIKIIQDKTQQEVYLEIIHDKSHVALNILRDGLTQDIQQTAFDEPHVDRPTFQSVSLEASRYVLNKMASGVDFAKPTDVLSVDVFGDNEVHKQVYNYIKSRVDAGEKPAQHMLYSLSQDEEVANILNSVKDFQDETMCVKYYNDSLRLLNKAYINFMIKSLSQQFDTANSEDRKKIFMELASYQQKLKELK